MKNIFCNSAKRIIALLFLGGVIFSFLHSELGLFNYDGGNHGAHDYCHIVKNTNTQPKFLQEILPKLEQNKDVCVHCFEEIEATVTQTRFERTDLHQVVKQSTEAYLFNRAFLI